MEDKTCKNCRSSYKIDDDTYCNREMARMKVRSTGTYSCFKPKMEFIIERTNKDETYTVISRHPDFDSALDALKLIKSELRHEIWCDDWVNTEFGYAPMAWIN